MDFTLRQLRYVLAVADLGHFGRAAAQCNVTQPALSQQVRQLERACGADLFERDSRSVHLTPFGAEFVSRARALMADAESLASFAEGHGGRPGRALGFGLIPTVAPYLLPDLYPLLTASMPDIRFAVSESRTPDLLAQIDAGQLDLALIATEPPRESRLHDEHLFEDPFHLAAPIEAPDLDQALESIPAERFLLLDEGHCLRDQAVDVCALRDRQSARAVAGTSLSTIIEFVANGQGVTLLPAIGLKRETSNRRISTRPLSGSCRVVRLVWKRSSPFGALFGEVAELIRPLAPR